MGTQTYIWTGHREETPREGGFKQGSNHQNMKTVKNQILCQILDQMFELANLVYTWLGGQRLSLAGCTGLAWMSNVRLSDSDYLENSGSFVNVTQLYESHWKEIGSFRATEVFEKTWKHHNYDSMRAKYCISAFQIFFEGSFLSCQVPHKKSGGEPV